ncbi:hypothetical protein JTB14_032564 [Gonioctena quinquepunctata]|nr:hypothetical protein JTB14_032564 [Gonioctena quinquepunctata]
MEMTIRKSENPDSSAIVKTQEVATSLREIEARNKLHNVINLFNVSEGFSEVINKRRRRYDNKPFIRELEIPIGSNIKYAPKMVLAIAEHNLEKAMNPAIWPTGTWVNRFFNKNSTTRRTD